MEYKYLVSYSWSDNSYKNGFGDFYTERETTIDSIEQVNAIREDIKTHLGGQLGGGELRVIIVNIMLLKGE